MFDDPSGAGAPSSLRRLQCSFLPTGPGFVVAIPVKDEEERLPACLRALAQQRDRSGQADSAGAGPRCRIRQQLHRSECEPRAKAWQGLSLDVRVVEAPLPPAAAHAGAARRAAMDLAEAWLVEARREGRRDPDHRR